MDSTGAGSEINCPSCGELITIPEPETVVPRPGVDQAAGHAQLQAQPVNAISSSAAAKVEMHLRVPTTAHTESLIQKPKPPLEVAAKETDKKLKVKVIRHTDCIEVGHDKFDEIVSGFLGKVGEQNIVSMNPINYTHLDIGTQKLMTEFGLIIVYRG